MLKHSLMVQQLALVSKFAFVVSSRLQRLVPPPPASPPPHPLLTLARQLPYSGAVYATSDLTLAQWWSPCVPLARFTLVRHSIAPRMGHGTRARPSAGGNTNIKRSKPYKLDEVRKLTDLGLGTSTTATTASNGRGRIGLPIWHARRYIGRHHVSFQVLHTPDAKMCNIYY